MSAPADRADRIRSLLIAAFAPVELDVIDESDRHKGHAGARDGRGHYRVRIVSSAFEGCSPIKRHRMVFGVLDSMLKTDIHALSIRAEVPDAPSEAVMPRD